MFLRSGRGPSPRRLCTFGIVEAGIALMTINPRHLMLIDRLTFWLAPTVRFAPAWKRVLGWALLVSLPALGLAGVADTSKVLRRLAAEPAAALATTGSAATTLTAVELGLRERSLGEAVAATGSNKGALKVNLHRALKGLKTMLSRDEEDGHVRSGPLRPAD